MLRIYLKAFFRFAGGKAWGLMGLMVVLGLTQGIGLVMILPFLHVIGIDASGGGSGYANAFMRFTSLLGLSPGLWSVISIYILVIAIYSTTGHFKDILASRLASEFTHHLRTRLYKRFCHAGWLSFLKIRDADIIHVLTHDIQRVAMATQEFFRLIVSGLMVVMYTLFSMTISLPMTCAALCCGGLFLLVLYPFNRKAVRFGLSFRNASREMYTMINEHIGGMKVSKSYNLEKYHTAEFNRASYDTCDQTVRFTAINSATRLCYQIGAAVAIALFIAMGVKLFHLSAVTLMVIVFLFSRILPGFSNLQQCFQRIANAMPSFQAVLEMEERFEFNQEPVGAADNSSLPAFPLTNAVSVDRVWFRYNRGSENWNLKNIQIKIPVRKVTAIAGHSGAGKTTLVDILLGLLTPEKGSVLIDGIPLDKNKLQAWRQCVGYVPQVIYLFHESIRSNLLKANPKATEAQLWDALEKASAKRFITGLPRGLDTIVGDRGINFSGGERQRISLARALLRKPQLLVLDEATSALDRQNEAHIQSALEKLKSELTIVVIAHRSSTIQNADHVVTLEQGQVISL